jgi:hypothetical protein
MDYAVGPGENVVHACPILQVKDMVIPLPKVSRFDIHAHNLITGFA